MRYTEFIRIFVFLCLLLLSVKGWAQEAELPHALMMMPESEHAVIVEKKTQTLYLYGSEKGGVRLKAKYTCSTGEVAGPKTKAGDKKTPEGVYFLKDEYEDRYLTPIYGTKAFPSDYPNFLDLRRGKQGSAIWIHGTDKVLKPMDSNGCIALENHNITALADYIRLDSTPLIIVENLKKASVQELRDQQVALKGLVEDWIRALTRGSYHEYLSFYARDYLPDISWWESWRRVRGVADDQSRPLRVTFENMGLYAHEDVVVAIMDMHLLVGGERQYLGKRQLFIQQSDKTPLIIGDLFQKKAKPYQSGEIPLVTAARTLVRDDSTDVAVVETVEQWLAAWSAKDMAEYAAFYANDFHSDGLGKAEWVKRKKRLAKRYDYILVTGKDYKVTEKKDGYVVSFLQQYKSSGFSTKGRKQLKLVKKGGLWKIFRENWKGK